MELSSKVTNKEMSQIRRDLLSELQQATSDPERMRTFTKFILSTTDYSFFNKCLMKWQFPDVVQVRGYVTWQKIHKRQVKPGEHAIKILAPIVVKEVDPKTKKETGKKIPVGFRPVNVFDISQTEGPEIELVTEMGLKVDNPEELLQELVFILALDNYNIDLQAMGFKEGSKVEGQSIHINNALDQESKIVEILNVLSKIHLQHYGKRKEQTAEAMLLETKMVTTIISNVLGKPVNATVDIDALEDKSITAIFNAADAVSKAIGVSLEKDKEKEKKSA